MLVTYTLDILRFINHSSNILITVRYKTLSRRQARDYEGHFFFLSLQVSKDYAGSMKKTAPKQEQKL